MGNIIDYLYWRGDLSFKNFPLNKVDNLILANLSYMNFGNLIKCNYTNGVKLSALIEKFLKKNIRNRNYYREKEDITFLRALKNTNRYKNLKIYGIINIIEPKKEVQFSALTIEISKSLYYISYGGTGWSIVGWKEDLNLSYIQELPSQEYAKDYINEVIKHFKGNIYIGGHSKGGNLALYAGIECNKQNRIINIFNNDGPNLPEIPNIKKYTNIKNKIIKIVPHDSIIGQFFENSNNMIIVESKSFGILQHEQYNWQVLGDNFIEVKSFSSTSKILRKSFSLWLSKMNNKERRIFVNIVYKICGEGKISYLNDVPKLRNIPNNFHNFMSLSKSERDIVGKYLLEFFKILIKSSIQKNN